MGPTLRARPARPLRFVCRRWNYLLRSAGGIFYRMDFRFSEFWISDLRFRSLGVYRGSRDVPGMKGEGVLDVGVPIVPVVSAGELLVLVGDVELGQFIMELAVIVEELILQAAIDAEVGELVFRVDAFYEGQDVVIGAGGGVAENAFKFRFAERAAGAGVVAGAMQDRAGVAGGAGEGLRVGEGKPQGAVAAHGQAADAAVGT